MSIFFNHIIDICAAKPVRLSSPDNLPLSTIALDSRSSFAGPASVFVAIAGPRHDSHKLLHSIYQQGYRNFIIERPLPDDMLAALPNANIALVHNSIIAMQKLAAYKRSLVACPVIGIAGSNGKTILKEWLAQLSGPFFNIVKSPGSYNSQTGVPLSVWQIERAHSLAIFEAGISKPNEMAALEKVIRPSIGVFTNIGSAHQENFGTKADKTHEKMLLFMRADTLIWHDMYPQIRAATAILPPTCRLRPWHYNTQNQLTTLWLDGFEPFEAVLPVSDAASIENLLHAIAVMLVLGLSHDQIHQQLKKPLAAISMRLELKKGVYESYIIDDSYNYDLAGLALALDFMHEQNRSLKAKKTVILSDLPDGFMPLPAQHQAINRLLHQHQIDTLIAVGEQIAQLAGQPTSYQVQRYTSISDFLANYATKQLAGHLVLVKGARKCAFEQIVERLEQKTHGTRLEINLSALVHNLNFYKSKLMPKTRLMVMVKALAYGSGSLEIANMLAGQGIDYLAVAYPDEGTELRVQGIELPIMVMNPAPQDIDILVRYNLEPAVSTFSLLEHLLDYLSIHKLDRPLPIHLELDTGMNRLGFCLADWPKLSSYLSRSTNSGLVIKTIFSHLAAADEPAHDDFTRHQIRDFELLSHHISELVGYMPWRHILNSAGIVRFADAHFEMVRLGIGLYGLEPGGAFQDELRNVSSLKTTISQIREVQKGSSVGYGRKGIIAEPARIATIAIGYGDGFSRKLGNGNGYVYIHGQKAPIIGNVCMDMCMADISQIGLDVKEGDQVIVFDSQSSLNNLASRAGTIAYEIMTGISQRVKRIYFKE